MCSSSHFLISSENKNSIFKKTNEKICKIFLKNWKIFINNFDKIRQFINRLKNFYLLKIEYFMTFWFKYLFPGTSYLGKVWTDKWYWWVPCWKNLPSSQRLQLWTSFVINPLSEIKIWIKRHYQYSFCEK